MVNSPVLAFIGAALLACTATASAVASCRSVSVPYCDGGWMPPLDLDVPVHLCTHWTKVTRLVCEGQENLSQGPITTHRQDGPTSTTLEKKGLPHR